MTLSYITSNISNRFRLNIYLQYQKYKHRPYFTNHKWISFLYVYVVLDTCYLLRSDTEHTN
jgi:hypothetical protein